VLEHRPIDASFYVPRAQFVTEAQDTMWLSTPNGQGKWLSEGRDARSDASRR
jgi:hypothetical protein